tara:strand:- start:269 stop:679 length:411 start_codon:yes stop_codon:yes gene_type:complete
MASVMNWRKICPTSEKNGNHDADAHRVVSCFQRIGRSMSDLTMTRRAQRSSEWDSDLMIFERAQGKSRSAVLFRNNDRRMTHLMDMMEPVPQSARKSITFDHEIKFRNGRKLKPGLEPRHGCLIRSRRGRRDLSET